MIKYSVNLIRLFKLNNPLIFSLHFLILFSIIVISSNFQIFNNYNLFYQDYLTSKNYTKLTHQEKSNIFTRVVIDDESFHHLAQSYGSTRVSTAKVIHEIKQHNPRLIIVDFLFYGKGLSVEDIYLTAAANSDIPIFFKAELTHKGEYFTPIEAYSSVTPNFGFIDLIEGPDDVIREIRTTASYPHTGTIYDMSSQISNILLNKDQKSYDTENSNINIAYFLKEKDIPLIPAKKVLDKQIAADFFTDKIVIIEGTASVYQNKFMTPVGSMTEGTIIANAIRSQTEPFKKQTSPSFIKSFLIIFIISLSFFLLTYHGSLAWAIIWNTVGLAGMFILSAKAFNKGTILPYTSLIASVIVPGIYNWLIRYLNLTLQSRNLIRMASVSSLTELYSFRYFCFLLQRSFIKHKKNKKILYVAALDIIPYPISENKFLENLPADFYKDLGKLIANTAPPGSINGFLSDKKRCFIAFRKNKKLAPYDLLIKIRNAVEKLITEHSLHLSVKIAGVDMETAHSHSSFQLIQILDNMLQKKTPAEKNIIEYEPSALTISIPEAAENALPDTDLSYVSLQIKEDQKDLESMKKQLSYSIHEYTMAQKMSAMGKLSSYYAHELKNPLHNLLNCFQLIEDPEEDEESKKETIQIMKSEIQRVVDLTKKMGSHFKPSDEKPSETNVNDLINQTLAFLNRKFKEQNIDVISEFDENVPSLFLVEDQIKQVFLNLFLNALDAMKEGGHLIIATFLAPPIVRITISDTGSGIAENDLERIFDVFYTTKEKEGTGIGLFACYNIIQQHGGSIKVQSNEDEGTCFEIILPL